MASTCVSQLPSGFAGAVAAIPELTPALYSQLRRIASRHLRGERHNHTLQPTALVHEAYLKLFRDPRREFANDVHFLALASRVMRQVLVDYARARGTQKRLGELDPDPVWGNIPAATMDGRQSAELIALDDALATLAEENPTLARLIEMRYFGGMTAEESAEALQISVHIVRHDLRFAQAWLRRRLDA
jgi:RNA polymerase sigma factor (TIGR02999 family)